MVGYATLGTNDLKRATAYYDALLAELGARRIIDYDRIVIWSNEPGGGMLGICLPFDGRPAVVGNGATVGITVGSNARVDRFHAKALALGGTCEGPPGDRGNGFYAGYFRDLDGNKLVAYHVTL
jgi:catechol 2,3-dioxygenase-like lactoylglutathione lyase family enzyme